MTESTRGYVIGEDMHRSVDIEGRIRHYTMKLRQFSIREYPEEWALCQYNLACLYCGDRGGDIFPDSLREGRAKSIETALHHFDRCMEVFTYAAYPTMWAISATFMGQLFRERITLTTLRSILSKRGSSSLVLRKGIDNVSEAAVVYMQNDKLAAERAICALEHGWLLLLQFEDGGEDLGDTKLLEESITYLERAISLSAEYQKIYDKSVYDRFRPFDPQDPPNFPPHMTLLMGGKLAPGAEGAKWPAKSFIYLEGVCMNLLGKAYSHLSPAIDIQQTAFDYLTKCLQPKYLILETEYYVNAHFLAANLILKNPRIANPEYGEHSEGLSGQGVTSIMHLDVAISHLDLASKSPHSVSRQTDLQFLKAQLNILKLHHITDNLGAGQSLTRALEMQGGNDIMETIDDHLTRCLKRITSADMNTQDAYIYFFSNLKLSEMRMLQTASKSGLTADER